MKKFKRALSFILALIIMVPISMFMTIESNASSGGVKAKLKVFP